MKMYLTKKRRSLRSGAVAVEFALTAPILFLIILGSIELSHAHMVLNTLESAAYEGARQGILRGATAGECRRATRQMLDACRVNTRRIRVTPSNLDEPSDTVTVEVIARYSDSALISPFFTKRLVFRRSCELQRE
jgi:Flp pilus assembly protein TadG